MPELYNNIMCVMYSDICPEFVSEYNYKNWRRRGRINQVRRACYQTPALIEFASLPSHIRKAYIAKYGDPMGNSRNYTLKARVQTDGKALQYFAEYKLQDGRNLPYDVQDEYVNNASVLNALNDLSNDTQAFRKALGGSKTGIWQQLTVLVNELKKDIAHSLPENEKRLREKLKEYKQFGYECLISGKFMNRNRAKVGDMQQEALLRKLLSDHRNFDNEQILKLYNTIAETMGWAVLESSQTVANYRTKWNMLIIGGLKGENAFDNTMAMQVKRKAPIYPLYYWTVDGWDVELLYQKTGTDKQGHSVTTYHNRVTAVIVLDPCGKYPVGYAVGEYETPALIRQALRNAVKHTAELFGKMHKPHQLQTDRYGKGNLTPFYEAVSDKYTPARAKNAKAKVIEPYFNQLNKHFQLFPNWSGHGVKSAQQPNAEFLNKIRHSFPDYDGVVKQIAQVVELERKAKIEAYRNAYYEMPEGDRITISEELYLEAMGERHEYSNRLQAAGLVVTLFGEKRQYDTFDLKMRELAHVDWTVKYDPERLDMVLAVDATGSYKFLLREKYIQPMALKERGEGDSLQLKAVTDFNKLMKSKIIEKVSEDTKIVTELLDNPRLANTLTKLVLVDSMGQHKDNRSAARLQPVQKLLEKQDKKEQKQIQSTWTEVQEEYLSAKTDINKYLNL